MFSRILKMITSLKGLYESEVTNDEVEEVRDFATVRNEYLDYCVDDFIMRHFKGVYRWEYESEYFANRLYACHYVTVLLYIKGNRTYKKVAIRMNDILNDNPFRAVDKEEIKNNYSTETAMSQIEDALKVEGGMTSFKPKNILDKDEITALIEALMEKGYQVVKDKDEICVFVV